MPRKKKEIPISVLKVIEPYLELKSDLYKRIPSDGSLIKFVDKEDDSDFFFEVNSHQIKNGKAVLTISFKPENPNSTEAIATNCVESGLKANFDNWVKLLEDYEKTQSVYDDPIISKYQKDFLKEIKLVDEDADTVSFSLDQQIWIDKYLNKVHKRLEAAKTGENESEIENIIIDVEVLQQEQTSLTKNQVVIRLAKIWAKIQKHGIQILKEIYLEARKEIIKQLVTSMLS